MSGHAGRKKRRGGHEEEHENHERWLVSYADMMTLLMVLFIVLFAISSLNTAKFEELKKGLSAGFGATVSVTPGGPGALDEAGVSPHAVDLNVPQVPQPGEAVSPNSAAIQAAEKLRRDRTRAEAQKEVADLEATRRKLQAALHKNKLDGAARFRIDERGLVVSIVTDRVIFPADRADLALDGRRILDAFAPVLDVVDNHLIIEGHTNTVKVRPKYFPSEWELSTARASAVVRYLVEKHSFAPSRMEAAGFADQRPLYPTSDPNANRLNRRVEVVLVSRLNTEGRSLLPEAAKVAETAEATAATAATDAH
jgi:chemotaxis protein MotB